MPERTRGADIRRLMSAGRTASAADANVLSSVHLCVSAACRVLAVSGMEIQRVASSARPGFGTLHRKMLPSAKGKAAGQGLRLSLPKEEPRQCRTSR